MRKLIIVCAACAMQIAFADRYYNNQTFSESEEINEAVRIGHEKATDDGSPDNALVTVKSGAVWMNTGTVFLGESVGTAKLTVESGSSVYFGLLRMATKYSVDCHSVFELQENAFASVTNIVAPYKSCSKSHIHVANGAVISNVCEFILGKDKGTARLELEGGSLFFDSTEKAQTNSMQVGKDPRYAGGVISGYGFVGFDNAYQIMHKYSELGREDWGGFLLYGQVIADGKGVERDLDFSKMGILRSNVSVNIRSTNGWYAVNKGRLLLPRCVAKKNQDYNSVGGYPINHIQYVNSFQYKVTGSQITTMGYIFSELYATDRSDIPDGLPASSRFYKSSIWRIGYFDHQAHANKNANKNFKQEFDTVNLKFHYDHALTKMADVDIIRVYRCTDEKNGGWTCVGTAIPSSENPYIQTEDFGPSPDLYNFGWFAIVGEKKVGTVVVVR